MMASVLPRSTTKPHKKPSYRQFGGLFRFHFPVFHLFIFFPLLNLLLQLTPRMFRCFSLSRLHFWHTRFHTFCYHLAEMCREPSKYCRPCIGTILRNSLTLEFRNDEKVPTTCQWRRKRQGRTKNVRPEVWKPSPNNKVINSYETYFVISKMFTATPFLSRIGKWWTVLWNTEQ